MNLPESQNNDLNSFFNQKDFVASTISQINKDLQGLYFSDFEPNMSFSEPPLHKLIDALNPILSELSKRQPEQLSQFIYKVDLNESKFIDSVLKDPGLTDLCYQIIEREAQKVFLRNKFR